MWAKLATVGADKFNSQETCGAKLAIVGADKFNSQ